jgi:hypothetical protein
MGLCYRRADGIGSAVLVGEQGGDQGLCYEPAVALG